MNHLDALDRHPVLAALGGRRGLVDGAVPPVVFVAVNAVAGLTEWAALALPVASGAATVSALAVLALRAIRGESLRGGLRGVAGLLVALALAAWTGQAKDFFLPGIYVDAGYALVFTVSALSGRPIVGYVHASIFRTGPRWRVTRRSRRAFALATHGWAGVFAVRAAVQVVFYRADQTELLALAKLLLGWPLTAVAVVATLGLVRRVGDDCGPRAVTGA